MTTLALLILIGGILHFGLLIASALVPRVLDWSSDLKKLKPLSRHLIWTHGGFIVMVIIGFGLLSSFNASELADGSKLARSFCGFVSLFWFTRLVVQLFVIDVSKYLTSTFLRVGYHGLTVLFIYFSAVFGWAAVG
jgi:hypothetical protein